MNKNMYPAVVNSPENSLAEAINESQITIVLSNTPAPAPNLLTIGNGKDAETILYTALTGSTITDCVRGFQGPAKAWTAATVASRNFTAYDHDTTVDNLKELGDRLDTTKLKEVTLNPGIQVVNSPVKTPFSLKGINGRTLVNLLGRAGACEDVAMWGDYRTTHALDSTNKTQGNYGLKITTTFADGGSGMSKATVTLDASKYYLLLGKVKNGNASSVSLSVSTYSTEDKTLSNRVTSTTEFQLAYKKFTGITDTEPKAININVTGNAVGQYGYGDEVRLYEISAEEYAAIDSMTPAQIDAKYPYVDSIQPVRNPYAIRYGDNLAPPFYEWSKGTDGVLALNTAYDTVLNAESTDSLYYVDIPVVDGVEYTYSVTHNGKIGLNTIDRYGKEISGTGWQTSQTVSLKIPDNTKYLRLFIGNSQLAIGAYKFKNPMLTLTRNLKQLPAHTRIVPAEQLWRNAGYGVSLVPAVTGAYETKVNQFVFSSAGNSKATIGDGTGHIERMLNNKPGHYKVRVRLRANSVQYNNMVFAIAMQNSTTQVMLKQTKGGSVNSELILTPRQIGTEWTWFEVPFYWDGVEPLELWTGRPTGGDIDSIAWQDRVEFVRVDVEYEQPAFKPREDALLALQADLFANPLTGEDADEIFEKDGQYYKLVKWSGSFKLGIDPLTADDYYVAAAGVAVPLGYKRARIRGLPKTPVDLTFTSSLVKFDGTILPVASSWHQEVEQHSVSSNSGNYVLVSIKNTDSGWGDNYTPTPEEVKAYFLGWKMFTQGGSSSGTYNGTGSKSWVRIDKIGNATGFTSTTVPTYSWEGYTPYQLVYQLATPSVEPIVSEGMLTLHEGDNQVEVGSGIVLREGAKPQESTNYYNINASNFWPEGKLRYVVDRLLQVYKGTKAEPWSLLDDTTYGKFARLPKESYDTAASYFVTYLMQNKSALVPFSGTIATNEKALLQELADTVQQNTANISVLRNKKTDKAEVGWLTPTLLNGWRHYGEMFQDAGYHKDSTGRVHLRGLIKDGAGDISTALFRLPPGYRPIKVLLFIVHSSIGTIRVDVSNGGYVVLSQAVLANSYISLDQISFLAEL